MSDTPNYRIKTYDISDFDDHMSLRLGANNLLLFLFLLSPLVLALVAWGISDRERSMMVALYGLQRNLFLSAATTLPVLFFCLVMLFKGQSAGGFVRAIWRRGRQLLQLSALLNCGVSLYIAFVASRHVSLAQLLLSGLSAAALVYALRSARLHDYFLQFPERPATGS
jgi:hypothetical protein